MCLDWFGIGLDFELGFEIRDVILKGITWIKILRGYNFGLWFPTQNPGESGFTLTHKRDFSF